MDKGKMSSIKETIKDEIERLKKILEESTYYLDNSQQALGYSFALDDFKEFIDSLPEEKPSEDLEEAAEEYRRKSCNAAMIPPVDGPTNEYGGSVKESFIAGAEWMYRHLNKVARLQSTGEYLSMFQMYNLKKTKI